MSGLGPALLLGTAYGQELRDGDETLRSPLPLSRRIAVTAVAGGSGTSTVAGSVAGLLNARRQGTVLGVDASGGAHGLGWQLGVRFDDATAAGPDAERRRHARSAAQARAGLPTTASGLPVLTLGADGGTAPPPGGRSAATTTSWATDAGPIARFFDVVVTDWGVRPATADLVEVAATSHVLAVVSRADRFASSTAAAVLPVLREQPDAPRVVLVLVDVSRTADRTAGRLAAELALPVCWIPYDRARAGVGPQDSRDLRSRTLRAQLRLGVTLMAAARQDPTRLSATRRPVVHPVVRPESRTVPRAVPPARSDARSDATPDPRSDATPRWDVPTPATTSPAEVPVTARRGRPGGLS